LNHTQSICEQAGHTWTPRKVITLIFMRREVLNEPTHRKWGEVRNYRRSLSQINRLAVRQRRRNSQKRKDELKKTISRHAGIQQALNFALKRELHLNMTAFESRQRQETFFLSKTTKSALRPTQLVPGLFPGDKAAEARC
jgi:hypothetical protein